MKSTKKCLSSGADLGGGGGGCSSPFRDSTPCRPKMSPFCTILRYPYLVTDPKIFLKSPLAPIYTNFEGGVRAKKKKILGQKFPKSA